MKRRKIKLFSSIAMSLIVLLTSAGLAKAEESSTEESASLNRVSNGDFENTYVANTRSWEFKPEDKGGSAEIVEDADGNHYAKIKVGSEEDHVLQKVPTTPGKTYILSADILADSKTNLEGIFLATKQVDPSRNEEQGSVLHQLKASDFEDGKGQWTNYTFEFTAQTPKSYVGIVKWAEGTSDDLVNTEIAFDNVSVTARMNMK